mmetsp:Transcript_23592/g.60283  ORF Transcript_23592/g.60283 Transcript_23592/m.60283 type:complete len:289 (+) Transcript_23592:2166-3032(+)
MLLGGRLQLEAVVAQERVHSQVVHGATLGVQQVHAQPLERRVDLGRAVGAHLLVVHAQLVVGQPLLVLHLLVQPLVLVAQLLLVLPVGSEAVLSNVVHLVRADLHLHQQVVLAVDGLMQALVAVGLTLVLDVVLGAVGHGAVALLHDAQRHVAVVLVGHHHTQRRHVVHLGQVGDARGLHLQPDAVQVLGAARDVLVLHTARVQPSLDLGNGALQSHGVLALGNLCLERLIILGVQNRERQVLQFCLEAPHSQAVGHHGKDVEGFLSQHDLLVAGQCLDRLHVVNAAG